MQEGGFGPDERNDDEDGTKWRVVKASVELLCSQVLSPCFLGIIMALRRLWPDRRDSGGRLRHFSMGIGKWCVGAGATVAARV
eukprot:COSAG05_NODE_2679_length_2775_cov_6.918161_3_plen_83_part_00